MIKLLWRFGLLMLAAVAFAWLADRPGRVTVNWLGREIEMSVLVTAVLLLAAVIGVGFLWQALRRILRSPTAAREFWRFRKHRKAYESLSKGIIAAGAGDAQTASKHAAIAGNTLSDEPLVNVLAAQAAQLRGDRDAVRRVFEEMAKSPETELMGLRGLFSEARQSGDLVAALGFAEKALSRNSRLPWASSAVLQVQTARRLWLPAAQTLDQQSRAGLLEKSEANRKRAALITAEAMALEDENRSKALELATDALKLDPALVPAACVAVRCHIADQNPKRALKILRAIWPLAPHPELADLAAHAIPSEGPEPRFERVRDVVGNDTSTIETAVAVARAALSARRFDVARNALETHINDAPQARVCALMAAIEEADGDKGKSRQWLARAIHAPRDPMWLSDGVANTRWVPVSPVTGEIVPCQWKVPFDMATPLLEDDSFAAEAPLNLPSKASAPTETAPFQRPPDDPGIED